MNPSQARPGQFAEVRGTPGIGPRMSGLLRILWPLFAGALLAGWLVRAALPAPALGRAGAGAAMLLLALGLGVYVAWSRRRLEHFLKGARGEETAARALVFLPAGFEVFHGVRLPGGAAGTVELDHVVVGPGGLFVIETKNWSGRITAAGGKILCDGREPDRPPLEQVRQAAAALRRTLAEKEELPLQPVLSFAAGDLEAPVRGMEGVIVCVQDALARVVQDALEAPWQPGQRARVAARLRELVD